MSLIRRSPVLLVALVLVGFVTAPAGSAASKGEQAWNMRLLPIVDAVEELRGLEFRRPVKVVFLDDTKFEERVAVDRGTLSDADRAEIARSEAQLRSVGLVAAGVDLLEAVSSLQESGVLAYYEPETEQVTVRGKQLDVARRVTLVHELTHALQDQHYDLEALQKSARKRHGSDALRALVEGDASRVEGEYVEDLSDDDLAAYNRWRAETGEQVDTELDAAAVPGALIAIFQSPYLLGPEMLRLLVADDDEGAIDDLFRSPPVADAVYLTPLTVLDAAAPVKVEVPALAADENKVGKSDVFGAFALYLVLATSGDPARALRVADGWGGDAMVTFTRGETQCVRATFAGKDTATGADIADSLQGWARRAPAGSASVTTSDGLTTLTACDPGAASTDPGDAPEAALYAVAFRNTLLAQGAGLVGIDAASCTVDRMIDDPTFAAIVDSLVDHPSAAPDAAVLQPFQERFQRLLLECGR